MKSRGMPVLYLFFFPPAVECNYMHQLRGLHRPRTSSPMMPSALCLALFISMVARVHSQCAVGTYMESITTFSFPSGVQINYPISAISNLGCTLCYNQPYSHVTMNSNILPCMCNIRNVRCSWYVLVSCISILYLNKFYLGIKIYSIFFIYERAM